ncbi:MAG: transposase [Burkholderiales bacterium PBB4]|nr:MAG: transposase [Burkholderiales bacterium PBB4]
MARLPRLSLAGFPHHVIQRGNNRQAIFLDAGDRQTMLDLLEENAKKQGVAVHAYVLMDNHLHLLVTPSTSEALPSFMQAVGRRYVRYFNDRHSRSGTLWEGRYRSTLVQSEAYMLTCMAYLDLNPVRAGMVSQASDFPWSSHGHYIGQRNDKLITPHPLAWGLGNTPFAREAAYATLVQGGLTAHQQTALTESVVHGWALGEEDFVANLQKTTSRRLTKGRAGRPGRASE